MAYEAATARAIATLLGIEKPVAATIHGVCIGRGLAIAACADLRVPADDARFTPRRPGSASVTTSRDSSGCRQANPGARVSQGPSTFATRPFVLLERLSARRRGAIAGAGRRGCRATKAPKGR